MFHQTHQVFHQIKFFNLNSESCVNTIGVDNDTLDETLDTLDAFDDVFDENDDTFDEKLCLFDEKSHSIDENVLYLLLMTLKIFQKIIIN